MSIAEKEKKNSVSLKLLGDILDSSFDSFKKWQNIKWSPETTQKNGA
jgi:hypothetical protein